MSAPALDMRSSIMIRDSRLPETSRCDHTHYCLRNLVRLLLIYIHRCTHDQLMPDAAGLLHHVGQLVGQQLLAARAAGVVLASAEEDVLAGGEGAGAERAVERVGLGANMHAHAAEIGAEGRLHSGAYGAVDWLTAAALMLDRRLDLGGNIHFTRSAALASQRHYLGHVVIPILPLQLACEQPGARGLRRCDTAQQRDMRASMRRAVNRACHE